MILTFPWRRIQVVDRDRIYVALYGAVQLQSVFLLPIFIQYAARIEWQLKRTPGVVGFRTAAAPFSLKFYHLSAWTDAESINSFVHTHPHSAGMQELTGRLGATVFRYWETTGCELPLRLERETLEGRTS